MTVLYFSLLYDFRTHAFKIFVFLVINDNPKNIIFDKVITYHSSL